MSQIALFRPIGVGALMRWIIQIVERDVFRLSYLLLLSFNHLFLLYAHTGNKEIVTHSPTVGEPTVRQHVGSWHGHTMAPETACVFSQRRACVLGAFRQREDGVVVSNSSFI